MASSYLKIIGRLTENKSIKIRHSYLVQRAEIKAENVDSPLQATCLDGRGKVLNVTPILARPYNLPREVAKDLAIRAFIPILAGTKSVRFSLFGETILDLPFPDKPPEIKVNWHDVLAGPEALGQRRIEWTAAAEKVEAFRAYGEYSSDNGRSWQRLLRMGTGHTLLVDLDRLPGGKSCKLALLVSDGVRVSRSESPAFANQIKPCVAMILKPADGATFKEGEAVEMVGQGFYLEEQKAEKSEIRWESSKNGLLGTGQMIAAANLSKGEHIITVRVGKGQRAGSKSIGIKIVA